MNYKVEYSGDTEEILEISYDNSENDSWELLPGKGTLGNISESL